MVVPLNHVYISMIKAFKTDCEILIQQFRATGSEDFRDFIPLWKALKFNLIYEKYSKQGIQYDFKEDTLQIAKCIMLNDNFVAGMFLLYGLYYVQESPKPYIRLEFYEFERLLKFLKEERKTLLETCQTGYMFARLLKNDAFAFVRFSREFSIEGQNRARLVYSGMPILMHNNTRVHPREWLQDFLQRTEIAEDLKKLDLEYFQKKEKLKAEHPELNLVLDLVGPGTLAGMEESLTQAGSMTGEDELDIGMKRRKLKNRQRKIVHRYDKRTVSPPAEVEDSDDFPAPEKPVRRGKPPTGQRKLYLETMINEAQSDDSDMSPRSVLPGPTLDLPDLL